MTGSSSDRVEGSQLHPPCATLFRGPMSASNESDYSLAPQRLKTTITVSGATRTP